MVNQYKYKFYLNANHAIFINNVLGQMHPHTWEIMIEMLSTKENFVQFDKVEQSISNLLEKYQDQFLNEVAPFDKINPTLENIVIYFKQMIEEQIKEYHMVLLSIEISETPSRSYIINSYDEVEEKYLNMNKYANDEERFINEIIQKNRREQVQEEPEEVVEESDKEEAAAANESEERKNNCFYGNCIKDVWKQVQIVVIVLFILAIICKIVKNYNIRRTRKDVLKRLVSFDDIAFTKQQE